MQVFAIAFLHAIIFWPNIILTEKISRASKSLLYTINHHKLLNLNLKFLLLFNMQNHGGLEIEKQCNTILKTNTSMAKRFFKEIHLKIALFWTIQPIVNITVAMVEGRQLFFYAIYQVNKSKKNVSDSKMECINLTTIRIKKKIS